MISRGGAILSVKVSKTSTGIKFSIRVIPKSSVNSLSEMDEGIVKVKITAPPVEGKANVACIKYLADVLGVAKSSVNIVSGLKSKTKLIEVTGDSELLCDRLIRMLQDE